MTQHYFTSNPQSAHDERAIQVELAGVRADFCTDAGVFSRDGLDFGSRLLIETVYPLLHGRVLDMGCGWGAIGSGRCSAPWQRFWRCCSCFPRCNICAGTLPSAFPTACSARASPCRTA